MTDANMWMEPVAQPRAIVESFLQTVVILDDLVVMSEQVAEQPGEATDTTIVAPDYPESSALDDRGIRADRSDVPLNADTVINAFADLGVVCAVLNAAPDNAYSARVAKAAHTADIVVLDWKIGDSDGDDTLEVMKNILLDDQNNPRLRLIAIYTGEPNLVQVSDRLQTALEEFYDSSQPLGLDPIRISKGPARVVILAKDGTINEHIANLGYEEVPERELADKLVDEFASMTSGLLRNVALAGIATIRENSHRVLAKFDETLDPAYLGHRMLLSHPPDAEDHLVAALGSELLSILEDNRPGVHAGIEAIRQWLASEEGPDISEPFRFPGNISELDGWIGLLQRGIDFKDAQLPDSCKKRDLVKRSTEPFSDNGDAASHSNRHFAALLSLKTRYPGQRPRLTTGSILCTAWQERSQYYLCLQPKCDSVRLESASGFPFIPLEPVPEGSTTAVAVVVEVQTNSWEYLGATPKPSELIVRSFEPGSNPPGEVLATEEAPGVFYFDDVDGTRYRWIAEMKEEHAFGIAGAMATALARPGPNDAEWLRRGSR